MVGALAVERQKEGGCKLREVDIHVDNTELGSVTEDVVQVSSVGTMVKIVRQALPEDSDDDEDFIDFDSDDDSVFDPFAPGGTFNDPVFDALYAGRALAL